MASELVPYQDIEKMAQTALAAGIFGFKTQAQAVSLMLVCQAEGLHPMKATQLFDILPTGKVGIKSAAVLANFQARGGRVKWVTMTDTVCEAVFSSPGLSEPVSVKWTWDDAVKAGLAMKQNWRMYPRQMLAARVTTDGVNRADPAARLGFYPTEVVVDMEDDRKARYLIESAPKEEPRKALGESSPDMPEEPTEEELEGPGIFEPDSQSPEEAREAIRAAFGVEVLNDEPKAEKPKRTPRLKEPTEPAPAVCPKCESEIGEFKSNSKTYPGRVYLQCRWAYGQKRKLLDIGASNSEANGTVGEHYRAWKTADAS